jgi:hypothetical protein
MDDASFNKRLHEFLHKKYNDDPLDFSYSQSKYMNYWLIHIAYDKNDTYNEYNIYEFFNNYDGCIVYYKITPTTTYYSIYVYENKIHTIKPLLSYLYSMNYIIIMRHTLCRVTFRNFVGNKVFKYIKPIYDEMYPTIQYIMKLHLHPL